MWNNKRISNNLIENSNLKDDIEDVKVKYDIEYVVFNNINKITVESSYDASFKTLTNLVCKMTRSTFVNIISVTLNNVAVNNFEVFNFSDRYKKSNITKDKTSFNKLKDLIYNSSIESVTSLRISYFDCTDIANVKYKSITQNIFGNVTYSKIYENIDSFIELNDTCIIINTYLNDIQFIESEIELVFGDSVYETKVSELEKFNTYLEDVSKTKDEILLYLMEAIVEEDYFNTHVTNINTKTNIMTQISDYIKELDNIIIAGMIGTEYMPQSILDFYNK